MDAISLAVLLDALFLIQNPWLPFAAPFKFNFISLSQPALFICSKAAPRAICSEQEDYTVSIYQRHPNSRTTRPYKTCSLG